MASVLIIDDDPDFCHGLTRIIQRMGHKAVSTGTMAQGLKAAHLEGVDIVFVNVSLPDGTGLALLPRMNQLPSHPEVIIITGARDPDGAELAMTSGAWDYIEKGASTKHIALAIKRAIEYRREH